MTFDIEIGGRRRTVTVESLDPRSQEGPYRVTIDGSAVVVDCRPTALGLSLIFDGNRSADLAVTERSGGEWLVQWSGLSLAAVVDGRRFRRGQAAEVTGGGEQRVTAPMPGRVIRVLVQPGEDVAARQGLVVVEAMKMENELGSPRAGRVREVAVSEGMSIEAGRLLVVVD
jgi:acetyl/propionyl-CoA carboxylase alpha subunit